MCNTLAPLFLLPKANARPELKHMWPEVNKSGGLKVCVCVCVITCLSALYMGSCMHDLYVHVRPCTCLVCARVAVVALSV